MTPGDDAVVRVALAAALSEVTAAEESLDRLLAELRSAPRAEKVTMTADVKTAFARLRSARAALAKA